jgi:hypothetical protein
MQATVAFGSVDHGQADAVLDRAAGVLRFELEEEGAQAGVDAADPDQGGIADEFEDSGARSGGHGVSLKVAV